MAQRAPRPYKPDALECAILLLLLVQPEERTRARLAEITLKRLWSRRRLRDDFLREVQDWLFRAGWALFYAGTTFAIVKTKAVEGWPRVTYKVRLLRDRLCVAPLRPYRRQTKSPLTPRSGSGSPRRLRFRMAR
jgi:hypothetical protein